MRPTCFSCFRPESMCLCAHVPRVDNTTQILVLQHPRERFHPFGSARMLVAALAQARLEVAFGHTGKSLLQDVAVSPTTGLLYPHPNARELSSLCPKQRPSQLLLLDGTWAHASRLYQDNPLLHSLPHYAISPTRKSRYLVRREPNDWCLSTLEAAVEALRCLEPETTGLDALLGVFERMNTEQVKRMSQCPSAHRREKRHQTRHRALTPLVSQRLEDLVLVHAENAEVGLRAEPSAPELCQGAAVRLTGAESWNGFVRPTRGEPSARALRRSELRRSDIGTFLSRPELVRGFQRFLRPRDVLVAWNTSTFRLLPADVVAGRRTLHLKGAYCNWQRGAAGPLASAVVRHQLPVPASQVPGRMGQQLALMQALAAFLHATPHPV